MSISSNNSIPTIALGSGFTGEFLYFSKPREVIAAYSIDEVARAIVLAQKWADEGFWAAGFVSYEAAAAFDPALRTHKPRIDEPLVWFGIFDEPDKTSQGANEFSKDAFFAGDWAVSVAEEQYRSAIVQIRNAIARGETYQTNYTFALETDFDDDPWAYFRQLTDASRAAYGAYINTGRHCVLSASPELFFSLKGRRILCRPMKGTAPRGLWSEQDREQAEWLRLSEKNRAENVMIVDLMRNDLGRIAETGSVRVPSLFDVEALPTVWQMTSTVEATLRQGLRIDDIFNALFPCGSITGAPKRSTMGLITDLEEQARGIYCGAIGVIQPGGDAAFNVAIRTVVIDRETKRARCGVGGGITWDSDVSDERREAMSKSAFLRGKAAEFQLLETLRLENGEFWLLDRHMDRLAKSAQYFDFHHDENSVRERLFELARVNSQGNFRVRLLASRSGSVECEIYSLASPSAGEQLVCLADDPVDISDPFLYHKTTRRSVYERHRAAHSDCFDVLLWNDRCEATEFTIGNLVVELDDVLCTPPVTAGLLPGTFRAALLGRGEFVERIISIDDVLNAPRVFMINSVRGWTPVRFQ